MVEMMVMMTKMLTIIVIVHWRTYKARLEIRGLQNSSGTTHTHTGAQNESIICAKLNLEPAVLLPNSLGVLNSRCVARMPINQNKKEYA